MAGPKGGLVHTFGGRRMQIRGPGAARINITVHAHGAGDAKAVQTCDPGRDPACAGAGRTLTEWGTLSSVVTADCAGVCDDANLIDGLGGPGAAFAAGGGVIQLSASSTIGDAARGATAHAEVVGGLSLPHLQVSAHSNADGFAGAVAAAVQGYTYTGSGETITLDVTLTGSVVNDNGGMQTGLGALAFLFTVDALTGFLNTPVDAASAASLGTGFIFLSGVDSVPADPFAVPNPFEETATNPTVNLSDSLSIVVADGSVTAQQFYLGVYLYAFADGDGQSVSATDSLNISFAPGVNTAALVAAGVPLPAALWLFTPALLLGLRRRRL